MNESIYFKTVDGQKTQTVAENVQIVLVISLTFIQEPDFELFLSLICGSIGSLFKDIAEFLRILSVPSFVFGVLDEVIFVDVVKVVDLLLIFDLAVVLYSIEIIIMKFSDKNF